MQNNDYIKFPTNSSIGISTYSVVKDTNCGVIDLILIELNTAFENIVGLQREEMLGQPVTRIFRDGFPVWNPFFQQLLSQDIPSELELCLPQLDSWYTVRTIRIDDDTLALLFVDVSVHMRHAEEVERFFQVSLNMFSISDIYGNFIKLNQKWEEALGYSIQELKLINYLDLIHPDDLEATRTVLAELEQQTAIRNFVNRYRARNGEYRFIEWQCMPNGSVIYASSRDITDSKLQEEKIESQEKFRQIVDNIAGVFWLMSADKKELLFVSSNYKRVQGKEYTYTDDPLLPLKEIVYEPDREKFDLAVAHFLESGSFVEEFRVVDPGNQVRWVTSSAFPVHDDRGKVQSYAGILQDITERKNIELSEAEKTRRLNAIVQAMPDLLFILSADGVYLDVISSDSSKLAAPPEQIIGTHIRDYFPDEADTLLSLIAESINEHKVVTGRYCLTIEGEVSHFEARITPVDTDKVMSVVRDVTELVTTTERLRFQTRMQQLLVKISNTYIDLSASELSSTINKSLHELGAFIDADRFYIFDYRKEEHAFYNTYEWCAPDIEPQIEFLQGTPADGLEIWLSTHRQGEIMLIHDVMDLPVDDPIRTILEPQDIKSIVTVPLLVEGEYVGFIGIDSVRTKKLFDEDEKQLLKVFAQTITSVFQRIRSQKKLEAALEKSKESDRLKSAFLATVSHELRTPLNHILGFSELIQMVTPENEIRGYAHEIYTSGIGLLHMIEDIFSIASAEKNAMKLRPSAIKGVELFMSSKNSLQEMLLSTGKGEAIRLKFNTDPELMSLQIVSDRQKIQQVLANLFSNAVKFTDSGTIEFGMLRRSGSIEFYVRDTGIGIAAENQKYLFDLFRQLDDSYSRRYDGLGIGLSIAQKIAEVLGATIRVESELGRGACFYFVVPVEVI